MNLGFDVLKKRILQGRGFNCEHYKESSLKRRIDMRMRALNIKSYFGYADFLKNNSEEYDKLLDVLTINFSEFFRDLSVFLAFQKKVLPELTQRKVNQDKKIIRVWSAGCAVGEEPYSIAIAMKEFLGENAHRFLIPITATDVNEKVLEKADKACYGREQLKNSKRFLKKYFEEKSDGYVIKRDVRNMIRFIKHDLISHEYLPYFDVIFCRNVLIYMKRETQAKIFENFHKVLGRDGYLIVGKTETLTENVKNKFEVVDSCERIFRKV